MQDKGCCVGTKVKALQDIIGEEFREGNTEDGRTRDLRLDLLLEELQEVVHAAGFRHDDERGLVRKYKLNKANLLKELCDLVYVTVGWAVTHGWDFDEAFRRVHASNMTKVSPEGQIKKRSDGKVLKGDHYIAPDLKDLV